MGREMCDRSSSLLSPEVLEVEVEGWVWMKWKWDRFNRHAVAARDQDDVERLILGMQPRLGKAAPLLLRQQPEHYDREAIGRQLDVVFLLCYRQ